MITERYIVYRHETETGFREELRGFRTEGAALDFMERQSFPTTLDWLKEEITRDGREIIDTEADIDGRNGGRDADV